MQKEPSRQMFGALLVPFQYPDANDWLFTNYIIWSLAG